MNSRRRWIIAGSGIAVLGLLVVVAFAWATWAARSYETDFKQWNTQQKFKMTSQTFADRTAFGYDGNYDSAIAVNDVKVHAIRCEGIQEARKILDQAADRRPQPTALPLEWLSPEYRKAIERNEKRTQVVNAYLPPALKVLDRMRRDCTFEEKVLHFDARRDVLVTRNNDRVDEENDPSCGKGGCIPEGGQKQQRFVMMLQQIDAFERQVVDLFGTEECTKTSFGDTCSEVADSLKRALDADLKYLREVKKLNASSSGVAVNQAGTESDIENAKHEKAMRRLLTRHYPGIEKVADFTDNPTSIDAFLGAVAFLERSHMQQQRDDLIKLGSST